MTRDAKALRHDPQQDGAGRTLPGRPQPGWFLHESAQLRQAAVPFQPQLDAATVRDYWRSRAQTFDEPPEIEPWEKDEAPRARRAEPDDEPPPGSRRSGARRREAQERHSPLGFAAMAVVAGCIGVGGGVYALDRLHGGEVAQSIQAWGADIWNKAAPLANAGITPGAPQDGGVKPVLTATLDVADVQGEASALIPLWLRADAGMLGREIALKIEGLPEDARLTAGTRIGGTWLLRSEEIADVQLMVPKPLPKPLALSVSAIEAETGALASPVKEFSVVILPAAAQAQPAANFAAGRRNFGGWGAP